MQIIFRAAASLSIRYGHVIRCLTLADALQERGAEAMFICREHNRNLCNLVEEQGYAVSRLPASKVGDRVEDNPAHAAWLGVSWQEDAEQTSAIIKSKDIKPDWLVVDNYAIDKLACPQR